MVDILLYSHHLPAWYCIDIVRRNSVLVTCGSERVKTLMLMIQWKPSNSSNYDLDSDSVACKNQPLEIQNAENSPGHLFVRYRHSSLHLRPLNFLVNSLDFQLKIQNNTHLMINFFVVYLIMQLFDPLTP